MPKAYTPFQTRTIWMLQFFVIQKCGRESLSVA